MANLKTVTKIDAAYLPDPHGVIVVDGIFVGANGKKHTLDFWIQNDGSGPVVWPGPWFLPYGGIYFNPVNLKIKARKD